MSASFIDDIKSSAQRGQQMRQEAQKKVEAEEQQRIVKRANNLVDEIKKTLTLNAERGAFTLLGNKKQVSASCSITFFSWDYYMGHDSALALEKTIPGGGIFRPLFTSYVLRYKEPPEIQQIFSLVEKMLNEDQISCDLVRKINFRGHTERRSLSFRLSPRRRETVSSAYLQRTKHNMFLLILPDFTNRRRSSVIL